jgi:hypothetical protein
MAQYLSNIDLNKNQLQNAVIHPLGTEPAGVEGQIYYNTATGGASGLKIHNGTSWVSVGDIQSVSSGTTPQLTVADQNGPNPVFSIVTGAVANAGTALATGDQIYDFVITNAANVTLDTTSHDYLSISGQEITLGAVSLADDTTGTLAIARGGTGQTTASAAANALLNTSQGGALSIGDSSDTITVPGNFVVTGTTTYLDESIQIVENNTISFEGTTVDAFEVKLTSEDATVSDKTITLPNATGTVALTSNISDDTITITAGDALTGGGTFTLNGSATEITVDHADTSSTASTNNSNLNVVQDVDVDDYGHVTGLESIDLTAQINALIDTKISATSYETTITDTDDINHALNTRDVIVQLYDATTYETVFSDVTRTDANNINVAFASTPTNSIKVLVQKIG